MRGAIDAMTRVFGARIPQRDGVRGSRFHGGSPRAFARYGVRRMQYADKTQQRQGIAAQKLGPELNAMDPRLVSGWSSRRWTRTRTRAEGDASGGEPSNSK